MLDVGKKIWLPCEVKPGPFSDERMVLAHSESGEWFGFVNERWLRDPHAREGPNQVIGTVVMVEGDRFRARIPGHTPSGRLFEGRTDRVKRGGSPLSA